MMPDIRNKFVMIALTRNEARIWATGLEKNQKPERIFAPSDKGSHHHVRQTQHQGGHSADPADWGYFDVIADSVKEANEILLIGHGEGKANAMLRFTQFMERNRPEVAKKIFGAIDTNLYSMTENELLATARNWFDQFHHTGISSSTTTH